MLQDYRKNIGLTNGVGFIFGWMKPNVRYLLDRHCCISDIYENIKFNIKSDLLLFATSELILSLELSPILYQNHLTWTTKTQFYFDNADQIDYFWLFIADFSCWPNT